MTSQLPSRFEYIASFAIVVLLSACGGGGAGDSATPAPAAAAMPASPFSPVPPLAPAAVGAPASNLPAILAPSSDPAPQPVSADAADSMPAAYTLVPASAAAETGGEAPYPDLRMLPTRITPFQPVAFGNVSAVAVTSVN